MVREAMPGIAEKGSKDCKRGGRGSAKLPGASHMLLLQLLPLLLPQYLLEKLWWG